MSETAYNLNLGYNGPLHEVEAALALTAGDLPKALAMVAATLEAAAQRCRDVACLLAEHRMQHEAGLTVISPRPVESPILVKVPEYRTIAEVEAVSTLVARAAASIVLSVDPIHCVAPISAAVIADAFAVIEARGKGAGFIAMHPADYADLRKFGRDILDIETQARLLKTGLMGRLWGAYIIVNREFPKGAVIVLDRDVVGGTIPADGAVVLHVHR